MDEVDVKDFQFRQLTKVKVSDPPSTTNWRCSLLCVSNQFGLTFFGCNQGVQVFPTNILFQVDKDTSLKDKADISCLKATLLPTSAPPLDVSLSSDNLTLSVCLVEDGKVKCLFFDVSALSNPGSSKTPFCSICPATTSGIGLCDVSWNPNTEYPDLLIVSLSNGSLYLLSVKEDVRQVCCSPGLNAVSVCWSPRGKQVALGLRDGRLLQMGIKDNAFLERRRYPCPDMFNGVPQLISDVFWVSTYNFALVYSPRDGSEKTPSSVFLTSSKTQGEEKFMNADDVFFGTGKKENKFFFSFLEKWGILVSSSSNALDTAVFRQSKGEWQKCELEDTGRAEFPLEKSNDETFAAGMAMDFTSQEEIVVNDALTLPPCPLLLMLSDHGVICPFTIINTGCPISDFKEMVTPPKPLPSAPPRQPKPSAAQVSVGAGSVPAAAQPPVTTARATSTAVSGTAQPSPFSSLSTGLAPNRTAPQTFGGLAMGLGGPMFGQPPNLGGTSMSSAPTLRGLLTSQPSQGVGLTQPTAASSSSVPAPPSLLLRDASPPPRLPIGVPATFNVGGTKPPSSTQPQLFQLPTGGNVPSSGVPASSGIRTPAPGVGGIGKGGGIFGMPPGGRPLLETPLHSSTPLASAAGSGHAPTQGPPPSYGQQQSMPLPSFRSAAPSLTQQFSLPQQQKGAAASRNLFGLQPQEPLLTQQQGGVVASRAPQLPQTTPQQQGGVAASRAPQLPQTTPQQQGGVAASRAPQLPPQQQGGVASSRAPPPQQSSPQSIQQQVGVASSRAPPTHQPIGSMPLQQQSIPAGRGGAQLIQQHSFPTAIGRGGAQLSQQHSLPAAPGRGGAQLGQFPAAPGAQLMARPRGQIVGTGIGIGGPSSQRPSDPRTQYPPTSQSPQGPSQTRPPPGPPTSQSPQGPATRSRGPPVYQNQPPPTSQGPSHAQPPPGPPTSQSPQGPTTRSRGPPVYQNQPPPTSQSPQGPSQARPPPGPPTSQSPQGPTTRSRGPPVYQNQPPQSSVRSSTAAPLEDASLSHSHIEQDFAKHIQDLVEKFAGETEDLKGAIADMFGYVEGEVSGERGIKDLGSERSRRELEEETAEVEVDVVNAVKEFEATRQSCGLLEEDTLKCFEMCEQAKGESKNRRDPHYLALQKLRPLDSVSSAMLTNLRSNFLRVQQSLQSVTSQLDSQLESIYEERRQQGRDPLRVPSLHIVYSTLKDHNKITRLQNVEIENIIRSMKELRLIPQFWQPSESPARPAASAPSPAPHSPAPSHSPRAATTPLSPPCTSPSQRLGKREARGVGKMPERRRRSRTPSTGEGSVTKHQMAKLREYFGNITVSPVRQIRIAPEHQLSSSDTRRQLLASDSSIYSTPHVAEETTDYGSAPSNATPIHVPRGVVGGSIGLVPSISSAATPGHTHPHGSALGVGLSQLQGGVVGGGHMGLGQLPHGTMVPSSSSSSFQLRQYSGGEDTASQSSLGSSQVSLQSDYPSEPDLTLTDQGEVRGPTRPSHSQQGSRSKYDVLLSERGIAINQPSGQTMTRLDSEGPTGGSGGGGTIHYKPQASQQDPSTSQARPGGGRVHPAAAMGSQPPSQFSFIPGPDFKLAPNPPMSVYTSKNSEGGPILHGSLPQLSSLAVSAADQARGELRKTDRFDDLTQIMPSRGGNGGGDGNEFGLLSGATSASVPNVNASDSSLDRPPKEGAGGGGGGVGGGALPASRLQSEPGKTATTTSSGLAGMFGSLGGSLLTGGQATRMQSTPVTTVVSSAPAGSSRLLSMPAPSVNLFAPPSGGVSQGSAPVGGAFSGPGIRLGHGPSSGAGGGGGGGDGQKKFGQDPGIRELPKFNIGQSFMKIPSTFVSAVPSAAIITTTTTSGPNPGLGNSPFAFPPVTVPPNLGGLTFAPNYFSASKALGSSTSQPPPPPSSSAFVFGSSSSGSSTQTTSSASPFTFGSGGGGVKLGDTKNPFNFNVPKSPLLAATTTAASSTSVAGSAAGLVSSARSPTPLPSLSTTTTTSQSSLLGGLGMTPGAGTGLGTGIFGTKLGPGLGGTGTGFGGTGVGLGGPVFGGTGMGPGGPSGLALGAGKSSSTGVKLGGEPLKEPGKVSPTPKPAGGGESKTGKVGDASSVSPQKLAAAKSSDLQAKNNVGSAQEGSEVTPGGVEVSQSGSVAPKDGKRDTVEGEVSLEGSATTTTTSASQRTLLSKISSPLFAPLPALSGRISTSQAAVTSQSSTPATTLSSQISAPLFSQGSTFLPALSSQVSAPLPALSAKSSASSLLVPGAPTSSVAADVATATTVATDSVATTTTVVATDVAATTTTAVATSASTVVPNVAADVATTTTVVATTATPNVAAVSTAVAVDVSTTATTTTAVAATATTVATTTSTTVVTAVTASATTTTTSSTSVAATTTTTTSVPTAPLPTTSAPPPAPTAPFSLLSQSSLTAASLAPPPSSGSSAPQSAAAAQDLELEDGEMADDNMESADFESQGCLGMGGLGGQPSNTTANPFGAAVLSGGSVRPGVTSPSGGGSILRQSAFGHSQGTSLLSGGLFSSPPPPSTSGSSFTSPPSVGGGAPPFGGGPTFGSGPSFGSSPSFGSGPSFGGAPSLGGSGMFGGGSSLGPGSGSLNLGGGGLFGGGASGSGSGELSFGGLAQNQSSSGGGFGGLGGGSIFGSTTEGTGVFGGNMTGSSFGTRRK